MSEKSLALSIFLKRGFSFENEGLRHKRIRHGNKVTVVTGLPGTGKSRLIKNVILPRLAKSGQGVVVVDPPQMEGYSGRGNIFVFRLTSYANARMKWRALISFIMKNRGLISTVIRR